MLLKRRHGIYPEAPEALLFLRKGHENARSPLILFVGIALTAQGLLFGHWNAGYFKDKITNG